MSDEKSEVELFANLPLLTQRALIRMAYEAIDATEGERAQMFAVLSRMKESESVPRKLRAMASGLRLIVEAVVTQSEWNKAQRKWGGDE